MGCFLEVFFSSGWLFIMTCTKIAEGEGVRKGFEYFYY